MSGNRGNIYEQRYSQHCCRNVSPVQLPFWPSFSLPAELFILQSIDLCNSNSSSIQTKSNETVLFSLLYEKFFSFANTPQTLSCFFSQLSAYVLQLLQRNAFFCFSKWLIWRAQRNLKSNTVSCFDFLPSLNFIEISRIIGASRKKLWLNNNSTTLQILLLGSRLFFSSVVTNSNKHVFWRQCVVWS